MIFYRKKSFPCKYTVINAFNVKPERDYLGHVLKVEKSKKIDKLVSNIYIYKFPPVLNWPDSISIDIPVDFIIAIRKILEHISYITVDNINELCFAFGAECSSFGDKILIIPIEYVLNQDLRNQFIDIFAHEAAHALAFTVLKDKFLLNDFKRFHCLIKSGSTKNKSIFFEPKNSTEKLSCYQYEDYKEFFAELASQILIYYKELIRHISCIKNKTAKQAYFDAVNFLLCFTVPISKLQIDELIKNIIYN